MSRIFKTVDDVEDAFYQAFQEGDMEAMSEVWFRHGEINCVHPMTPELGDLNSILISWEEIFDNAPEIEIEIEIRNRLEYGDIVVSVVHEYLTIPEDDREHPPVIATNIYHYANGSWHMISHHGSAVDRRVSQSEPRPVVIH
ncbi:MAG: nuclear transport factor 2 family protein [Gammaproteobacteria bacterium]|nr:nuclear transport factor 2 family protein [Gammaproteobacteria bacterium]